MQVFLKKYGVFIVKCLMYILNVIRPSERKLGLSKEQLFFQTACWWWVLLVKSFLIRNGMFLFLHFINFSELIKMHYRNRF